MARKASKGVTKGKGEKYTENDVYKKWIHSKYLIIILIFNDFIIKTLFMMK